MLTVTIVILNSGHVLNIMVKDEQRILDVINILIQNNFIKIESKEYGIYVRSWRLGEYINNLLTFRQSNIFYGDILYLEVEER